MREKSRKMALGGMLAALALVIMCMGGLIPVATYVCPMLCALLLQTVLVLCGRRVAWCWYAVVSVLAVLMGPDKEAALVFVFLGYYPIVKPKLDHKRVKWLWKLLLFNTMTAAAYGVLIHVFGMAQLAAELQELGAVLAAVMLVLGNVTFILLDMLLDKGIRLARRK